MYGRVINALLGNVRRFSYNNFEGAQKNRRRLYGVSTIDPQVQWISRYTINSGNIKRIHFSHLHKTCLKSRFWWIWGSQCFYCIGDWTPETNLFEEWNKRKQCPGELGLSNLECRPYLNEKIPQEHYILIIRKISVVVSVWRVSFTTHLTFSCSKSTLEALV